MASRMSMKQRDLLDGALLVFARDGYARASIDGIATQAGVSTRTIYNHYPDKAALFHAVIMDSAERTAQRQIALVDRLLGRVVNLESDLVAFGLSFGQPDAESAVHFAMIRQIRADADHISAGSMRAWRVAGPLRVRCAIGAHLRRLADEGMLEVDDENLAALHLVRLTADSVGDAEGDPEYVVRQGVSVFLSAYGITAVS